MSRAQDFNSKLSLVQEEHRETADGSELWAFLYEEKVNEDLLPSRRRSDVLHVYVTRAYKGERLRTRIVPPPLSNVVDPQVAVVVHLEVARPEDSLSRKDPIHADSKYQSALLKSALDLADSGPSNEALKVTGGHIQQLAREAIRRHKASLSEARDYLGAAYFGNLVGLDGRPLESFTAVEERSMNCLQTFYMLYAMGLRANTRQLISELWGYSDNQVKFAFQFLKDRGILSQRQTGQGGNGNG